MTLKKANRRRRREGYREVKPPVTARYFCYMLYDINRELSTKFEYHNEIYHHVKHSIKCQLKRHFGTYSRAIAHLTRLKLNIEEEVELWTHLSPCKIVEGWYTESGKEIITNEIEFPDEYSSPQRRNLSGRQRRYIRRHGISLSEIVEYSADYGHSWSDRPTGRSEALKRMESIRMPTRGLAPASYDRWYTAQYGKSITDSYQSITSTIADLVF